jgi:AmiR/NasT family two-component response regulator
MIFLIDLPALAAGAKSFIVKPLNPERVLSIVKKFLD